MRIFLTGGTGYIGTALVRTLREHDHEVKALVRTPSKGATLEALDCELVDGDLSDRARLREQIRGFEGVIHNAGIYKVGIGAKDRPEMLAANVTGTENVLDAATEAGAERITYVSTANAFGNTHGVVVDETHERPAGEPYVSYYDETKYLAHEAALERIGAGIPIVIAMPTVTIGPGDHSSMGTLIRQAATGKLHARFLDDLGVTIVYLDDAAAGIAAVHERGRLGESYVIGGHPTRLAEVITLAARSGGKRPPRLSMPTWMLRMGVPFGPVIGKVMRQPPNLRELISAAHGVTYWASDAKARRELGYSPRDLETAVRLTVEAELS
ncbi:MAG TPA: NAD-dependent epimerase/dehydratase family protein [Actinomycetota bacterium]|nr:NAD-dependent epimerase/dehydratase family protein [Actinomycetota bacterium]